MELEVFSVDGTTGIRIDEKSESIILLKADIKGVLDSFKFGFLKGLGVDKNLKYVTASCTFNDILSSEIYENGKSVLKTNRTSQIEEQF